MKPTSKTRIQGVVQDIDGHYVVVRLEKTDEQWRPTKVTRFETRDVPPRITILRHGVHFGLSSRWRPTEDEECPPELVDAKNPDSVHVPCGAKGELDTHVASLGHNLLGVVPEDAYLVSLPLALVEGVADSFVTVHLEEAYWKIGIVIDKKLTASLRLSPATPDALSGHLARVERYWALKRPRIPFPSVVYSLSERGTVPVEALRSTPVFVSLPDQLIADNGALKAAGVALSGTNGMVPLFSGPTPASSFRKARTGLYVTALTLVILGPLVALAPRGLGAWYEHRKSVSQDEYRQVMAGNQQIRELMTETNRLAKTALRLEETFSRRTSWGRFLDALGRERPKGLYLGRMDTRPIGKRTDVIRVALAGSSTKTTAVTTFIAKLQDMPFVSNVKLSSMERDKKRSAVSNFKILCTLTLSTD
ncbi:MAG: hypothetical protein GF344_02370 [Chitinivibrionales bacterium]|nr:hypothetical protein [Chitinivibrionales bacterium]MBD3355937.1 hypothetical protein [Chitinivibrionales bacterium]